MYTVHSHCPYMQDEWTPLMTASFDGHVDVVRVLIEAHADIHSQDKVWCTGQPAHRLCYDSVLYIL